MTTNLHDKMLAAIDAYFSASDGTEEEVAENLLLDVRDEINKQQSKAQPAPVQEPWVGLSEEEINKLRHLVDWTAEWSYGRFAYELERLLREKNARPQPAAPEFYHHVVENEGDWSEWVNPDNDSYMMKCCDCGLVHEMQFKVAKYSDGDECEFVGDPDLQPVFRARRAEEAWQETDTPPAPQPVPVKTYHDGKPWPVAPKPWVGLTDEERNKIRFDYLDYDERAQAIEAKLKEKNT